jgi:hypothetical protein
MELSNVVLEQQIAETFRQECNDRRNENFKAPHYSAGSFRPNKLEPYHPEVLPD